MTADEVAALRGDIKAGFARLEVQVSTLKEAGDDGKAADKELAGRVRSLEDWRQRSTGLVIGVALGSGLASGGVVVGVLKAFGG